MARPAEIISMYRSFLKHGAFKLAKLLATELNESKVLTSSASS